MYFYGICFSGNALPPRETFGMRRPIPRFTAPYTLVHCYTRAALSALYLDQRHAWIRRLRTATIRLQHTASRLVHLSRHGQVYRYQR